MKYYHVTDEKSAKIIMKEGLIPQIGKNSSAVSEKEKRIYLCRKKMSRTGPFCLANLLSFVSRIWILMKKIFSTMATMVSIFTLLMCMMY